MTAITVTPSLPAGLPGFDATLLVWMNAQRHPLLDRFWAHDFAVTYKIMLSVLILAGCFHYRRWLDFGIIVLATGLMLVAEMFNTTIEALCDFLEPRENKKIGIIKDIAAAAAGISILVWCIVIGIEAANLLLSAG